MTAAACRRRDLLSEQGGKSSDLQTEETFPKVQNRCSRSEKLSAGVGLKWAGPKNKTQNLKLQMILMRKKKKKQPADYHISEGKTHNNGRRGT